MSLPAIVLIPGAWHTPQHYAPLIDRLKTHNYDVVSERLPSVGSSNPRSESTAKDAAFIKNSILLPLLDAGKDVFLLMHSYGGCPGAAAAKGLSKAERQGSGGIVGLVFMCAAVAAAGDSLLSKLPGQEYDDWIIQDVDSAILTVPNPKSVFYNLVGDAEAQIAIELLLPLAEAALSTKSGSPAWPDEVFNGRRAYIQTEQDQCFPFVAQDAMVTYSGVEWDVVKLDAGHSPFLSHAEEVAEFVMGRAKAYA